MNYISKLTSMAVLIFAITSCGGEENTQAHETPKPLESEPVTESETVTDSEPVTDSESVPEQLIELSSLEILANPEATFKTTKRLNYLAYNEADINITLFITNRDGEQLARYHIHAGDYAKVKIQLQADDQIVIMRWHHLEHVQKEYIEVADLSDISFNGFE